MTSVKTITRAEVATHNNSKSAWICIGNKVYDVTEFLDEHPGGCEVLLEQAGLDATEAYEDVGHSTDAKEMKENYLVAEIVDEEKKTYLYDKKHLSTANESVAKSDAGMFDSMVYVALIASILTIIYYLLFY